MKTFLPYVFDSFSQWVAAKNTDPSLDGFSVDLTCSLLGVTEGELGEMLLKNDLRTSYIYDNDELIKQVIRAGDVYRILLRQPVR